MCLPAFYIWYRVLLPWSSCKRERKGFSQRKCPNKYPRDALAIPCLRWGVQEALEVLVHMLYSERCNHVHVGRDVYKEALQEVWTERDPCNSREKKGNFLSLVLSVHGKRSGSQTACPFCLAYPVPPESDLLFPTTGRGSPIAYPLLSLCIFLQQEEFWDPFSQKRSTVEKEDIFHVKTILKEVRPLVFKEDLSAGISGGLCFQINCMLLSLASGHRIKSDEPTKQHWAAPANSHHQ